MRRKATYQELANTTLAKTQLGVVTQPYVPFNDNALAVKELQAMTDRLALETRVNQNTQAQVFSTAASSGLPPQTVQGMVDYAEMQRRLDASLQSQFRASQTTQATQQQRNTELVIEAIGKSAQAHQRHLDTMSQVHESLRGSTSKLEQAAAAMAGHTGSIGPQITTAMDRMSGQIGQAVAMAGQQQPMVVPVGVPVPAASGSAVGVPVMTSAIPTATAVVATAAPATPPADQLVTFAQAIGAGLGQGARELSRMLHNNLHDFFVQAAQQNTAQAQSNRHLQDILMALRSQPGMQVFQYFDQRQHNVLTQIQNIMNFAPRFQQQINVDQRMQIGRMMLQNVVNVLYNQQIQPTPQNVNGALQAITNGQLALQDLGGDIAIPLPDAVRTDMPLDPLSPSSVPVPSPTITGVVSPEADVPTETTIREPPNRGQPRSPTLQEVPTEPEPPPSSPPPTEVGDLTTDPTVTIPQSFNQNVPPPPPPKAKAVTGLTLAPRTEPGPIRVPPKILNPADAARAGAPNEPPPGREGIKQRRPTATVDI